MVDIHTHIIPFVDDGSDSLEDSIEMVRHAISIGVSTIYCTPHYIKGRYEKSIDEIKENFDLLVNEVKRLNLPITLYLGQEILYTGEEDIIKMLNENKLLTLNNSKYILLEFPFVREIDDLGELIYNFSCYDYKVIIAHIERYEWMDLKKVYELKNEGALIQINADSLLKLTDKKEYKFVKKLLKLKLVDFIASDTHSFRPSNLNKIKKNILKNKVVLEGK